MHLSWLGDGRVQVQVPEQALSAYLLVHAYDGFSSDRVRVDLAVDSDPMTVEVLPAIEEELSTSGVIEPGALVVLQASIWAINEHDVAIGDSWAPPLEVQLGSPEGPVALQPELAPIPDDVVALAPKLAGTMAIVSPVPSRRVEPLVEAPLLDDSDKAREQAVPAAAAAPRELPPFAEIAHLLADIAGATSEESLYDGLLEAVERRQLRAIAPTEVP